MRTLATVICLAGLLTPVASAKWGFPPATKFVREWSGTQTAIQDKRLVAVRSQAAWKKLWAEHAPGVQPPIVDFQRHMVYGVFNQTVPAGIGGAGQPVRIFRSVIDPGGHALQVWIRASAYRSDRAAKNASTFHLVVDVPSALPVTFRVIGGRPRICKPAIAIVGSLPAASITRQFHQLIQRRPTSDPDLVRHVNRLVEQLGARRFSSRERATRQLAALGMKAAHLLRDHLDNKDPEIRRRLNMALSCYLRPALYREQARKIAAEHLQIGAQSSARVQFTRSRTHWLVTIGEQTVRIEVASGKATSGG